MGLSGSANSILARDGDDAESKPQVRVQTPEHFQ
jgi:hypothetical protein